MSIEVTQDDLQKVYDLLIATCEHNDAYHARGAEALRIIGALKAERDALAALSPSYPMENNNGD